MRLPLLLASLLALVVFSSTTAHARRIPNPEFQDRSDKTMYTADLRGSITVINFWATWCGPCLEELPLISKLNSEYSRKKVRFIAVSADETENRIAVDRFVKAHGVGMEIWLGADLDALHRTGLGNELPTTLISDAQGEIVTRVLGKAHQDDIRRPIGSVLNGKNVPAPAALVKRY
jgi:thiol-disulfide isomerase/thioredoxin